MSDLHGGGQNLRSDRITWEVCGLQNLMTLQVLTLFWIVPAAQTRWKRLNESWMCKGHAGRAVLHESGLRLRLRLQPSLKEDKTKETASNRYEVNHVRKGRCVVALRFAPHSVRPHSTPSLRDSAGAMPQRLLYVADSHMDSTWRPLPIDHWRPCGPSSGKTAICSPL
jgi:hypothetical protein